MQLCAKLVPSNAKSCIYLESQHPGEVTLLRLLKEAIEERGVNVLFVAPLRPMYPIRKEKKAAVAYRQSKETSGKKEPRYLSTFETLASLKQHSKHFTMAGMVHGETQAPVYCHSKLCIVDGQWFTIGSANFVDIWPASLSSFLIKGLQT